MDYNLIYRREVTSTNSELLKLVKENPGVGETVLAAEYQTDGRGQGSHGWDSGRGENILFSWLVYPEFLSASEQFRISKAVSLALCDYLSNYIGNLSVKWPNDILAGSRKIAGILIENSIMQQTIQYSVIGVGLNLRQEFFPEYPLTATSLFLETGRKLNVERQTRRVLRFLYNRYEQLRDGKDERIDRDYIEKLFRYGQPSLFEAGNRQFEGTIVGVNAYGQLEVSVSGIIRSFDFREINLLLS
ncbi:MAG: biotin--[acetyl-CoA-carboxylase] ligase [Bacteroidales bacterium]|nr:biotin--[acetyl-CoA-carboxylase] ligase [Bacteroidales bacterium]